MKYNKNILKKTIKFLRKNYFLTVFITMIVLVGIIAVFKYTNSKLIHYYVKVQVNYPASYFSKPDFWMIKSLKSDAKQYNILGNTEAELLDVRYYPNGDGKSYNIYLNVKLTGSFNKKTGEYTFQRSQIGVGSPITLNFSASQLYGTVIDVNSMPFKDKFVEKTITLIGRATYFEDDPSIFNSIRIGDKYFDGKSNIFNIIDKNHEKNIIAVQNNLTGQVYSAAITATENIIIKAKILVLEKDNQLIFAGNQILTVGSKFIFSTNNFDFSNFIISGIN